MIALLTKDIDCWLIGNISGKDLLIVYLNLLILGIKWETQVQI